MWLIIPVLLGIYAATRVVGIVADGTFIAFVDWFQRRARVSNAVAGELFQALGTSAPEIAVNVYATYIAMANPALGVSAIIGSALFQITVVIAVPMLVNPSQASLSARAIVRSTGVYAGAVLLLVLTAWDGVFETWELMIYVLGYLLYVVWLLFAGSSGTMSVEHGRQDEPTESSWFARVDRPVRSLSERIDEWIPGPSTSFFGLPIVLIVIGVFCAITVELAEIGGAIIGLSSSFMALTVLAAGSSVPELASNVSKARQGKIGQVIGNALGSNSFDIFVSFGGVSLFAAWNRGGLIMPDPQAVFFPAVLLLGFLLGVILMLWSARWQTKQWMPYTLLIGYVVFVAANLFV